MKPICDCDECGAGLCFGAVKCDECGSPCDPDKTRGFTVDRSMIRGDTWQVEFDLVDAEGVPLDLSAPGLKVWFTVAATLPKLATEPVLWQGTLANGGIAPVNAYGGRARVTMPATATQYLADGIVRLYYDLQILDLQGRVSTVERGIIHVEPDVTRAIS